jgi:outer membrane protein TolC
MLKRFKLSLLLIGLGCINGIVFSQSQVFSLEEARLYGLENRKVMKIADLEILSAQKRVLEATSIGLPQVNAEINYQQYIDIPTSVVDASFLNPNAPPGATVAFRMGTTYSANAGISASQLLFDGSYFVGLQVSKHVAEFTRMNKDQKIQNLQYEITRAYYNVLVAKANVQSMDSIVNTSEALYQKFAGLQALGMIQSDEVDQIEINALQAKAARNNALRMLDVAKNLLKMNMGYPYENDIDIASSLTLNLNQIIVEYGQLKNDVQQNMQLILLDKRREISEYELKHKKYVHFPQLSAFFSHQQMAFRNEFNFFQTGNWFPATLWGITMKIPISSGGMRNAQMQQAKIDVLIREEEIAETKRMFEFQQIQLINEFESAIEQLRLEEKNIALATKLLDNAQKKSQMGLVGAIEITQLYAQMLNAQANYVRASSAVFNTKNDLDNLYSNFNKETVK